MISTHSHGSLPGRTFSLRLCGPKSGVTSSVPTSVIYHLFRRPKRPGLDQASAVLSSFIGWRERVCLCVCGSRFRPPVQTSVSVLPRCVCSNLVCHNNPQCSFLKWTRPDSDLPVLDRTSTPSHGGLHGSVCTW